MGGRHSFTREKYKALGTHHVIGSIIQVCVVPRETLLHASSLLTAWWRCLSNGLGVKWCCLVFSACSSRNAKVYRMPTRSLSHYCLPLFHFLTESSFVSWNCRKRKLYWIDWNPSQPIWPSLRSVAWEESHHLRDCHTISILRNKCPHSQDLFYGHPGGRWLSFLLLKH